MRRKDRYLSERNLNIQKREEVKKEGEGFGGCFIMIAFFLFISLLGGWMKKGDSPVPAIIFFTVLFILAVMGFIINKLVK